MKKIIVLVCILIASSLMYAQKTIKMESEGGVYKIPCVVNGARMKMIFDTGASSVSLSMSIANFLYENEYITKEDIIGKGKSQTASGDIVDHITINLKDIEIAGLHLRNIKATVIDGQNAPLLLGQTAIQALGSVTINGNYLVINDAPNGNLSDSEIGKLRKEYLDHISFGSYYAAKEPLLKLKGNGKFEIADYNALSLCHLECEEYEECIENCKEMLLRNDAQDNLSYVVDAQIYIGDSYYYLGKFKQAIPYYQKIMSYTGNDVSMDNLSHTLKYLAKSYGRIGNKKSCTDTFNMLIAVHGMQNFDLKAPTKETSMKYKGQKFVKQLSEDFAAIAEMCILGYLDVKPSGSLSSAIRFLCDYLGYDMRKVLKGSIKGTNPELANLLFDRGLYESNSDEAMPYIRLAAAWGSQDAQKFISEYEYRIGQ